MFSLIVSIIALVLVIVLAGAAIYYGGDGFNQGTIKAEVARYKNEAQQIAGALVAYQVDNKGFVKKDTNDDGVVDESDDDFGWDYLTRYGYLKSLPSSIENEGVTTFSWGVKDNLIILPGVSDDVCLEANRMDGFGTTEAEVLAMEGSVGAQQLKADDPEAFVPTCDVGLDGTIPCCYDPDN